jgi:hypothetical protein
MAVADVLNAPPVQLHSHHLFEEVYKKVGNVEVLVIKKELHKQGIPLEKKMEEECHFELNPSKNSKE